MPEDGSESPTVQLVVIRDDHLRERLVAAHHHVTSRLPLAVEAGALQGSDAL